MSSYGFPKKAEDSAAASGDDLCPIAVVRKDGNDTALTGTDGDYTCLSANDVGNLKVQLEPTRKATFAVSTGLFTPAVSATDVWQLYAGSNKIVKVLRITYVDTETGSTAVFNNISLIKRSTANSIGTPVTNTIVPLDSTYTADAVSKHYTANPTLGTTVGTIAANPVSGPYQTASAPYSNSNVLQRKVIWDHLTMGGPIVLRGTGQGVVLNCNGSTLGGTSPKFYVEAVWTEE